MTLMSVSSWHGPARALHGLRRRRGDVSVLARRERVQGTREDLRDRPSRRRAGGHQPQVRARARPAAARRLGGDHARLPPRQAPLEHGRDGRQRARAVGPRHGRGLLRPRCQRAAEAGTEGAWMAVTSVLVTGATDGLGRMVAADLAERGLDVHVHGRDEERLSAVAKEIGAAGSYLADFSSLEQVRALAAELPPVDVLVNNAGLISRERVVTGDGIELTFQVNYLAPFLLTLLLLERAAPRRVVNVASAGQMVPDLQNLMLEHGYDECARTGRASSRRSCSRSSVPSATRTSSP